MRHMESDLQAIEFDIVRRLLAQLTFSPYGADAVRELRPAPNLKIAQQMQTSVTAARHAVDAANIPPLPSVPDIRAALRQASQAGAALSAHALANIGQVIALGKTLKILCEGYADLYPASATPKIIFLAFN